MRLLKAGNRYLSLQTMDDLEKVGARSQGAFQTRSRKPLCGGYATLELLSQASEFA
jgi:hypothetical protein